MRGVKKGERSDRHLCLDPRTHCRGKMSLFSYSQCKGNIPCTSYSRTFTIHNYGYGTAYTFTHNMIMLEHTAMNGTNTTKHTDANIAQF